jgi:hypothetical protein
MTTPLDEQRQRANEIEQLNRVASLLYGARWHSALANDIGVSVRQVQRWLGRLRPIPLYIWPLLAQRLAARHQAIDDVRGLLHQSEPPPRRRPNTE